MSWRLGMVVCVLLLAGTSAAQDWPHYGGDAGGTRHSSLAEITPDNIAELRTAWTFHTGDLENRPGEVMEGAKFEATPILVEDRLVFCTPFNEVIALDPGTGAQVWRHDPHVATDRDPANDYNCRGVTQWRDAEARADDVCATRIFMGTADFRLLALDARSGAPCEGFGDAGEIAINPGMELLWPGEVQISSPPIVLGDVVIVGSAIGDNARVAAPHGSVRAFDARTGTPRWSWDPVPRDARDPRVASWGEGWREVGHANVWAPMSVDEERGLVFLPTSSPSPDFFGGLRPGDNRDANSIVALRARDGSRVWAFQTVHHDVWDYDNPAQPTLATLMVDGVRRDVVIAGTKQGFLFVLDRDTGQPIWPVEERATPQDGVDGEMLSPTQPHPTHVPELLPRTLTPDQAAGATPWDRGACSRAMERARFDGLYTPPSTQGTILYPFTGGGVNWGGVAVNGDGVVFVNTSRLAHLVTLIPSAAVDSMRETYPDREISRQAGTPYGMMRDVMRGPLGLPCAPMPWGVLAAVDLNSGRMLWQSTLGTSEGIAPLGLAMHSGTPTLGGPIVTEGGLVFIGATFDPYLRAFDASTGDELWRGRLPAAGVATPMTYAWQGRQYVVIAAGGYGDAGIASGDAIVAFALPRGDEPRRSLWDRTIDQPGGRFWAGLMVLVILLGALTAEIVRAWRGRKRPTASS